MPDLDALAPPSRFHRLLSAAADLNVGLAQGRSNALGGLLAARCRRRPLALLLDEAHTPDCNVGAGLLNASQEVRGAGAAFLLVLAGTPQLQQRLNGVDASFWSRCTRLGVGHLTAQASAEALTKPLEQHGLGIETAALQHVVVDSQHYPYFVQLWGEVLWGEAHRHSRQLSLKHARTAQAWVDKTRNGYYADIASEN